MIKSLTELEELGMATVKITVIKKLNNRKLYGDNPPADFDENWATPICNHFSVGQEFIVVDMPKCPPGFCSWAFADIQRDLVHILFGGSYPWMKEKGVAISCCTDGLRPVIFKIKRIEDQH